MIERLRSSVNAKIGAGVAAGLMVMAATWFLLIAPQRSKAGELEAQVQISSIELAQRRAALKSPPAAVTVKPSDLFRLTKALPNDTDIASILLDVNKIAGRNDLSFRSITPAQAVPGTGYLQTPLAVVVEGRFGDVSRFLGDLRSLVSVKGGRLDARGRLYSVSAVDITPPESPKTFPVVKAAVTLNAYVFSAAPPADDSGTPPTTPAPSSNGTVAAGATP